MIGDEEDLSTKQDQTKANSWLPCASGDGGRSQGPCAETCKGTQETGTHGPEEIGEGVTDRRFPRSCRILHGRDFQRVMLEGRKVLTRNLIVFAAPGQDQRPRLGLAVGKGVGKAVCRNRWRRLIREIFRIRLKEMLPAVDLVVAVKSSKNHTRHAPSIRKLAEELEEAVRKIRGMR